MKRFLTVCLSALLLLCCAACGSGQKESVFGLLGQDDIKALEDSYWLSQEELFQKFSLQESDIEFQNGLGLIKLSASKCKSFHDIPLTPVLDFSSMPDMTGFYSVSFSGQFELEQEEIIKKAYDELVEEATGLYGEETMQVVPMNGGTCIYARWKVGEQSSCKIAYAEEADGVYLSITYRVVIPGSIQDW